ncbi:MAG: hypothetical protein GKS00_23335 [Alphaproteobacteria bacterium]|nr:hypothetical protein [Alphaproteobacteria bacterium]
MDSSAHESTTATFQEVEQTGLKLAIKGRIVAIVFMGAWLIVSRPLDRALEFVTLLSVFAFLGLLHYVVIGTGADRPWVKFVFITCDVALLSLAVILGDSFPTADLPQMAIFRFGVFQYYFIILAVAAFSFSPAMLVWSGMAGALGWLGAYAWSVRDEPTVLNWSDIPPDPTQEQFYAVFFSPNFAPIGAVFQEILTFLVVAVLIAIVMRRARATVRRQLEAERDRAAISQIFGRYVPESVVAAMVADEGALAPVERPATVLFADLAEFTQMTEHAGARGTMAVINQFFDSATEIIGRHNGIVTQFQGDALMATFNLPVEDPDHATHAVRAAHDILATVNNQRFGGRDLSVRIGVATGNVMAGNIGGGGRQSYTVYGDAVNLAARLEEMNKTYGTSVLFTESTADLMSGAAAQRIGEATVRGVNAPVAVYTLEG